MDRYKYIILGLIVFVTVAGAVFFGVNLSKQPEEVSRTNSSAASQQNSNESNAGGLSVDQNSQEINLGQLNTENDKSNNTNSSEAKKATDPFDPTTFAQYEKYKNANGGLFADIKKGAGAELVTGKKAVVLYKGWLTDGQLFDQSKPDASGQLQAFAFTLGEHKVIPGWEQATNGMKAGGVRLLIVPPTSAYGEAGQGPVPPNAVLIFKVELLTVE